MIEVVEGFMISAAIIGLVVLASWVGGSAFDDIGEFDDEDEEDES